MAARRRRAWAVVALTSLAAIPSAHAADAPPSEKPTRLVLGGWVETDYAWSFARPANGLNALRVSDAQHDAFSVDAAVLRGTYEDGPLAARLAMQGGALVATDHVLGPEPPLQRELESSRWIQEAWLRYAIPGVRAQPSIDAGLFVWPLGPEGLAVHEQWCWSRSNLFVAMPVQVAGVRASASIGERVRAVVAVLNGWSGLRDDNPEKSFSAGLVYEVPERIVASVRWLGGVERPVDAPEGRPFRQVVDVWVRARASARVELLAEGNGGFERTGFGASWWIGAALGARVQAAERLFFAARIDGIRQLTAASTEGTADAILPVGPGVASGTATVDLRPCDFLSVRLEYRHDQAGAPAFFRGEVLGTGSAASPWEPNTYSQDTLLVGGTAWF